MTPTRKLRLAWTGEELAFRGGAPDASEIVLDGDGESGPSPVDGLLLSLAACMGVDIVHILEKGRVPVTDLDAEIEGERAEEHPRRFKAIRIVFTVTGPESEHRSRLERALALSRDTYCSVLHTLRPDIDLDMSIRRG